MKNLVESRQAIRHLLDERSPADAIASYYAFHHPDAKTQALTYPADAARADGYVVLSRTGMDLFRPFVTLRLPIADMAASIELIYQAIMPGTAVILIVPPDYLPLLQAVFALQTEERLRIFVLDQVRFEPIINVLVTETRGPNNLPRFIIRRFNSPDQEIVASAGLNWQSPTFAEISANTVPNRQRQGWGRSVVAAMANYLLSNGRTPLYVVSENNAPSSRLAHSVGFADRGIRRVLLQATLKSRP
ncbi:MAG: GNAT family N-acetyltransferase [Chloroflexi bacterium]|nr:GNAT family N-acetyltransferase [Chloroflexota bacterium]